MEKPREMTWHSVFFAMSIFIGGYTYIYLRTVHVNIQMT
jgi:hypothetical protein